jgi:uncharacterized protein (TIGR03435 family)
MKTNEVHIARASRGVTVLSLLLVALAAHSTAQTHAAAPAEPAFEVASLKHVGNVMDGAVVTDLGGGKHQVNFRERRPVKYTGVRLLGEDSLDRILRYAFSPLLTPYHCESLAWMEDEFYQIEAIAPVGTTIETAGAMLRTVLVQRLGLRWKMVDRERSILNLLRGNGDLKLVPSTEAETDTEFHQVGVFKRKSGSLADLAGFLSMLAGAHVFDKTGITERYKFDEDWSHEITGPWGTDPNIAFAVVKKLGLKLEAGKQMQKTLVIERANKEPTPN